MNINNKNMNINLYEIEKPSCKHPMLPALFECIVILCCLYTSYCVNCLIFYNVDMPNTQKYFMSYWKFGPRNTQELHHEINHRRESAIGCRKMHIKFGMHGKQFILFVNVKRSNSNSKWQCIQ